MPFQVICGTSAGAINAVALAALADDFDGGIQALADHWMLLHAHEIYRADALGVIRSGARWLTMLTAGWALARWRRADSRSVLDNTPLGDMLRRWMPMARIPQMLDDGHLDALSISASSYTSGEHVTFYESRHDIAPWQRTQRVAVRARLGIEHLLASSAIPFVFPPHPLQRAEGLVDWFGDGSMRETAPLSPAIHLGAHRVLVVGAGRIEGSGDVARHFHHSGQSLPPSLAQITGHALATMFLDALPVDIERVQRINQMLALTGPSAALPLRPVDVLVMAPSRRIDEMAGRHLTALPKPIRTLLGIGSGQSRREPGGSALASYLLFEPEFTGELMALGRHDALQQREAVCRFFGWNPQRQRSSPDAPPHAALTGSRRGGVQASGARSIAA